MTDDDDLMVACADCGRALYRGADPQPDEYVCARCAAIRTTRDG